MVTTLHIFLMVPFSKDGGIVNVRHEQALTQEEGKKEERRMPILNIRIDYQHE